MTKDEMITWYLNQAEKDGTRNYGDNLTVKDVAVLMSMWHDQELDMYIRTVKGIPIRFSSADIAKLKKLNDSNIIEKYQKLGLFGKI